MYLFASILIFYMLVLLFSMSFSKIKIEFYIIYSTYIIGLVTALCFKIPKDFFEKNINRIEQFPFWGVYFLCLILFISLVFIIQSILKMVMKKKMMANQ